MPEPEQKPVEYHRLSAAAFEALEKQVPSLMVDNDINAHRAGFVMGAQYVLALVRKGFAIV